MKKSTAAATHNMPVGGWSGSVMSFVDEKRFDDHFDALNEEEADKRKVGPSVGGYVSTMPNIEPHTSHLLKENSSPKKEMRMRLEAHRASQKNLVGQVTKKEFNTTPKVSSENGEAHWASEKQADASLEARRARAIAILSGKDGTYKISRKPSRPASVKKARSIRRDGAVRKQISWAATPKRDLGVTELPKEAKKEEKTPAPTWALVDQPASNNKGNWGNMVKGLGRGYTVSQCRDLGSMPSQRRTWTDLRGTVHNAK